MARSIIAGQQAMTHSGCLDGLAINSLMNVFCMGVAQVLTGTADTISFPSIVVFNGTGADAATLNLPLAGPQPQGDDGKRIIIIDMSGKAHSVTTAQQENHQLQRHHRQQCDLTGPGGVWIVIGQEKGVSFS